MALQSHIITTTICIMVYKFLEVWLSKLEAVEG